VAVEDSSTGLVNAVLATGAGYQGFSFLQRGLAGNAFYRLLVVGLGYFITTSSQRQWLISELGALFLLSGGGHSRGVKVMGVLGFLLVLLYLLLDARHCLG